MAKFALGEIVLYRGIRYRYGGYCREKRAFYLDSLQPLGHFIFGEPN